MKKLLLVVTLVCSLLAVLSPSVGLPSLVFVLLQPVLGQNNATIAALLLSAVLVGLGLQIAQALGVGL